MLVITTLISLMHLVIWTCKLSIVISSTKFFLKPIAVFDKYSCENKNISPLLIYLVHLGNEIILKQNKKLVYY